MGHACIGLGTGSSQGKIYISGKTPSGRTSVDIANAADLDKTFGLSLHMYPGRDRSFFYFNGAKLNL